MVFLLIIQITQIFLQPAVCMSLFCLQILKHEYFNGSSISKKQTNWCISHFNLKTTYYSSTLEKCGRLFTRTLHKVKVGRSEFHLYFKYIFFWNMQGESVIIKQEYFQKNYQKKMKYTYIFKAFLKVNILPYYDYLKCHRIPYLLQHFQGQCCKHTVPNLHDVYV